MQGRAKSKTFFPAAAFCVVLSVLAGAALADDRAAIGREGARHLLNRTGFDAHPDRIEALAGLPSRDALETILGGTATNARTPAPAWTAEFISPRQVRDLMPAARKAFQREQVERAIELKGWWVTEMLKTPSPLTERMTGDRICSRYRGAATSPASGGRQKIGYLPPLAGEVPAQHFAAAGDGGLIATAAPCGCRRRGAGIGR